MDTSKKIYSKFNYNFDWKFVCALVLCLLARLIPFRVPNIEPIMATVMPVGRAYGAIGGFSFAALSILLYDVLTNTLGVQTFFTLGAYAVIGAASFYYFKEKQGTAGEYVRFAIIGTLLYDALTGLTTGPLFFHQSFMSAFLGQIPFTLFHLLGNIVFAFMLSPAIYKFLIKKKEKESSSIITTLNPKTI